MDEAAEIKNTFTGYLGSEFQQKLMWQLLVEPDYAERTIENLSADYFDDPTLKRLFIILLEYFREYEKTPSLQNQSVYQAINLYKSPNNPIEEESLYSALKKIYLWNQRVVNKEIGYDGDMIQNATNIFIKQQEYRKLGEYILTATKTGKIKEKKVIGEIEDKINSINVIGEVEDYGTEVIEDIDSALKLEFRETIPTGITVLDNITGGGLGKSEIGLILSPSGIGKTTILSKIANTAYVLGKNVLQIIFEDTENEVKRKHYALWSKIPLSDMDDKLEEVGEKVRDKIKEFKSGKLIIKRFTKDHITIPDIKNWIERYQKKFGIKFDIVLLDYLDCVDSHKKTSDRTEAEFMVVKSFLNMGAELNIPLWSATQGNRDSFTSEVLNATHQGGSIKRIQKAHFVMSIAKTESMKEAQVANIKIIKARFAQDGQVFKECIFNNNTMEITIVDDKHIKTDIKPKDTESELDKLNKKRDKFNQDTDESFFDAVETEPIRDFVDNNKSINDNENNEENNNNVPYVPAKPYVSNLKENKNFYGDEEKNVDVELNINVEKENGNIEEENDDTELNDNVEEENVNIEKKKNRRTQNDILEENKNQIIIWLKEKRKQKDIALMLNVNQTMLSAYIKKENLKSNYNFDKIEESKNNNIENNLINDDTSDKINYNEEPDLDDLDECTI